MKNGWRTRPLADFVKSKSGDSKVIKGKQSDQAREGLVQGYSASGPDVWVERADYSQSGVVISAIGARCGKTFLANGKWTAIANTHVLIPSESIDTRWLWYRTNDESFWMRGGTAQPFVKVKDTLQRPCSIPPLPEQKRIVAILDEAFEGIATARANAEKNLGSARAIFESHSDSVFTQRGEGWNERVLGDVCERVTVGHVGITSPYYRDQGVLFLRTQNVGTAGLVLDDVKHVTDEFHESLRNSQVRPNDVLMSRVITNVVRCALVPSDFGRANCANVVLVRAGDLLAPEYLVHYIRSRQAQRHLLSRKVGSAQLVVNTTVVKEWPIPLPSLSQQHQVVDALDTLAEETQHLEAIYQRKLVALDALKQSLLNRAFSGQL